MADGPHDSGGTRRDFLVLAASAMGAVGAASVAVPFISSMEPARDTLAAGAPVDPRTTRLVDTRNSR